MQEAWGGGGGWAREVGSDDYVGDGGAIQAGCACVCAVCLLLTMTAINFYFCCIVIRYEKWCQKRKYRGPT